MRVPVKEKPIKTCIHKLTNSDLYRPLLPVDNEDIQDIETWTNRIMDRAKTATHRTETEPEIEKIDDHLAHILEAKQSNPKVWNQQRHNRE